MLEFYQQYLGVTAVPKTVVDAILQSAGCLDYMNNGFMSEMRPDYEIMFDSRRLVLRWIGRFW